MTNNISSRKPSFWFVSLILLGAALIFILLIKKKLTEGFTSRHKTFEKLTGPKIYDDYYVSIYDDLVYDEIKNNYEVGKILNVDSFSTNDEITGDVKITPSPRSQRRILDIGSGTGHHINLFNKKNIDCIGLDNSKAMIEKAKENYPKANFKQGDVNNSLVFNSNEFTDITCFYFTIYYIKDKRQFFNNCFKWLMPGGRLFISLVDADKFDPIIPSANPFTLVSPQNYVNKRLTKSIVEFDKMKYRANFKFDKDMNDMVYYLDNPNGIFEEVIKSNNDDSVRKNEHKLYMNNSKKILELAQETGFILLGWEELTAVDYKNHYLYSLYKPSN